MPGKGSIASGSASDIHGTAYSQPVAHRRECTGMRPVQTVQTFAASVHDAERCWFDTSRWQSWVDGLAGVLEPREPWPMVGGGVTWESGPAGRGRVTETVVAYAPGDAQTVDV